MLHHITAFIELLMINLCSLSKFFEKKEKTDEFAPDEHEDINRM